MSIDLLTLLPKFGLAAVVAWLALIARCHGIGRPFCCWRSSGFSIAIIGLMAAIATGVGIGAQSLVAGSSAVLPAVAIALPSSLLGSRAIKGHLSSHSQDALTRLASLGVVPLLRGLDQSMNDARDDWVDSTLVTTFGDDGLEGADVNRIVDMADRTSTLFIAAAINNESKRMSEVRSLTQKVRRKIDEYRNPATRTRPNQRPQTPDQLRFDAHKAYMDLIGKIFVWGLAKRYSRWLTRQLVRR